MVPAGHPQVPAGCELCGRATILTRPAQTLHVSQTFSKCASLGSQGRENGSHERMGVDL